MVSLLNIQVHLPEKYNKTPLFILTNLNYRFLEIRAYQCYGPQRKIMVSTEPLAHFAGTLTKSFGKLLFRQSLRRRSQLLRFRLCFCFFANPSAFARSFPLETHTKFLRRKTFAQYSGLVRCLGLDPVLSCNCSKQLFCSTRLFQNWRVREIAQRQV